MHPILEKLLWHSIYLKNINTHIYLIDHLEMGMIRTDYKKLTPEDNDQLTNYLWPIVREMIKTAVENEQNLIIEGCYIEKISDINFLYHIKQKSSRSI